MSAPDLLNTTLIFLMREISIPTRTFVPVPTGFDGTVIEIRVVINAPIGFSDAILTPKINGVAITNGAITITLAGSAAGDVSGSFPTGNNAVRAGDAIEIESDGNSIFDVQALGTIVIRR